LRSSSFGSFHVPCHLVVHRFVSSLVQAREGFLAAAEEAARLKKKFKTQQAVTDALGQVNAVAGSAVFSACHTQQMPARLVQKLT
jgi:hypothetical protein